MMRVCPNCFADVELKGFLRSSTTKGTCLVCCSKDVELMDIEELFDFFQELMDNFKPSNEGEPLKAKIQAHWSFFASHQTATKILNEVLSNISTHISNAEEPVKYTDDIIENYSYWEKLKEDLKWERRFVSNIEYLTDELGWDGFFETA